MPSSFLLQGLLYLAGLELSMELYQLLLVALIEYLDQGRLLTEGGAYFGSGLQR